MDAVFICVCVRGDGGYVICGWCKASTQRATPKLDAFDDVNESPSRTLTRLIIKADYEPPWTDRQ